MKKPSQKELLFYRDICTNKVRGDGGVTLEELKTLLITQNYVNKHTRGENGRKEASTKDA